MSETKKDLKYEKRDMDKEKIYKHNFPYGVLEIVFFVIAINFVDSSTILPLFITLISGSPIFIGVITTIFNGGTLFPQIFFYRYVEKKEDKKGLFIKFALLRSGTWAIMGLFVLLFPANYPLLRYLLFFTVLAFTFLISIEDIIWADLISKIIDPAKRGMFIGLGSLFGSILAIGTGFFIKWLLSKDSPLSFPFNFSLIFFLTSIFFYISVSFYYFVKVIDDEPPQEEQTFSPAREVFEILKTNINFTKYILVNFISNAFLLSLPFFFLYGRDIFSIPDREVGFFMASQNIGRAVFTYLFGLMVDKMGHKSVLVLSSLLGVVIIIISIFLPWFSPYVEPKYLFYIIFLLSGAVLSGKFVGSVNYLLDIAPPGKVPAFRGISNSLISVSLLIFPSLGGVILKYTSYFTLFLITLSLLIISTIISFSLEKGRASS